jgi:hypothetical protein
MLENVELEKKGRVNRYGSGGGKSVGQETGVGPIKAI